MILKLLLEISFLVFIALYFGSPAPQIGMPFELENYFTNEEWYTELTTDEQEDWVAKIKFQKN